MNKQDKTAKKNRKREKGQAMVEFAVSLIILLIILSGIIDLGRMFFYYIAMRDAAQEGVVYGIIDPLDLEEIRSRTCALLSDNTGIDIVVTLNNASTYTLDCSAATAAVPSAADACSPHTMEVAVIDPSFPISMPFLATFLGRSTITLDASVTGTILRPQCP
jgi:Flp pilus assembly protein TadG